MRSERLVRTVSLLLLFGGLGLAAAIVVPDERYRALGGFLRRPADVTAERIRRLRHVLTGAAVLCLAAGRYSLKRQEPIAEWLRDARAEAGGWPAELRNHAQTIDVRTKIALALIVGAGLCLRLNYINTPMAYDEAYSFTNFARRPIWEAVADYNNTNNHPLNSALMHIAWRIGGQREWVLRIPVLLAGMTLLVLTFPWARRRAGLGPAVLATALVAGSPMLVDYSVNARGYEYVAAAALALDLMLLRLHLAPPGANRNATWLAAVAFGVVGLWTMPIMLYPLAGLWVWFALAPLFEGRPFFPRLGSVIGLAAATGLFAAAGYAPAYVFRGFLATENPFVQPLTIAAWLELIPVAWRDGWVRWIAGPIPLPLWFVMGLGGVVGLLRRGVFDRRTCGWAVAPIFLMFLTTAVLMAAQRVAPPPRLFLFLAPWWHLVAGVGVAVFIGSLQKFLRWISGDAALRLAAYVVVAASVAYAWDHPILREPHQRELGIGSVPAMMTYLKNQLERPDRLLAPLPCDHPSIFYASKLDVKVEINGLPKSGDAIWLATIGDRTPDETLGDVVVNLKGWEVELTPWTKIAAFTELTLWKSERPRNQRKPPSVHRLDAVP